MNESLFQLATQYEALQQRLVDQLGELDEATDQALEKLETDLVEKTDNVAKWTMFLESEIERLTNDGKIIAEKLKVLKRGKAKFEEYVSDCMARLDVKEFAGETYKVKRKKPVTVVNIVDEEKLPFDFVNVKKVTTTSPDKKAIKEALQNGEEVPGAELSQGKKSIKIERK